MDGCEPKRLPFYPCFCFPHRSDGGGDGSERGPFSRCMEGMRKEAERSSWLNSVVMTHSLAGGTGSGLGSGLLQVCNTKSLPT